MLRSLIEGPLLRGEEELLVKDVMVHGSWDLGMLSFDFHGPIHSAILATPLRRISQSEDQLCWISSSNGDFDSKNAYLLAIGENLESPDFHGKWLWKLNMPPKIQVFLWKCLHNSFPVKSILTQRGIADLGGCDVCPNDDEDILHVLRDCHAARVFWDATKCPRALLSSFSSDLESWITVNAKSSLKADNKDYPWCTFFLFGIWNLWLQRNRRIFKQQAVNPSLLRTVEMQVREYFYCVKSSNEKRSSTPKEVRWLKPAVGWLKLNTDGSVVGDSGVAGCGGFDRPQTE